MIEIELPCCDETVLVEAFTEVLRCERCSVEVEVADDPR